MRIQERINPKFGKVFTRISDALHRHFKDVEWVNENPDIIIIHVIGGEEAAWLLEQPSISNVVMFQHCYYTTYVPEEMWRDLWSRVKLVASFHQLTDYTDLKFNFYRTPIGAEPELFPMADHFNRYIKVFTTGHVADTECLGDVYRACELTNNIMYHTGENFKWSPSHYKHLEYMNDAEFGKTLGRSQYITGLRLVEGFEAMCMEGAMTGAIPIVPDLPTYSYYKDFGRFIDVSSSITDQLASIFNEPYKGLNREQVDYVRDEFSWSNICHNLQKEIMHD